MVERGLHGHHHLGDAGLLVVPPFGDGRQHRPRERTAEFGIAYHKIMDVTDAVWSIDNLD